MALGKATSLQALESERQTKSARLQKTGCLYQSAVQLGSYKGVPLAVRDEFLSSQWAPQNQRLSMAWASKLRRYRIGWNKEEQFKAGKRRNVISMVTYRAARDLGFNGSFDEWARLMALGQEDKRDNLPRSKL